MELGKLIKLVKSKIYYIIINIIVFVYMIIPFVSVKVITNNNIEDITYSFGLKYLFNKIIMHDHRKKKYQVHLKTFDKIFILYTSQSELIYKHNTIREISEKVNPPRSLFIKYDVIVNGRELSIDEKVFFKKYADGTKVLDMLEFNGIKLTELKVLKNNVDFKIWKEHIEDIGIEEIYAYL